MSQNENTQNCQYKSINTHVVENEHVKTIGVVLPILVVMMIIVVVCVYAYIQRKNVAANAEQVTEQMAEYVAENISNEISYAQDSIKLSAINISQTMSSDTLENPSEIILPMVDNTPFGSIEYIRADGMNVMNIGEPFDASDRVYYIEGIKGNTGIWNNYHPKTSKDTLVNFYTPLIYEGEITGVLTGYIEARAQMATLFETKLYGQDIHGIVVDENDMVICSTVESEFVPDLTLDLFIDQFDMSAEQKQAMCDTINNATDCAVSYKDRNGEGRICLTKIPNTEWKVVIIVPASSFNAIINENTTDAVMTVTIICLVLVAYAAYVLLSNIKRRKEIAAVNAKLEEENRTFNEENIRIFSEISEIRDIIASANMGTWRIELVEGEQPRMYVDDTMKMLLGIEGQESTPEETYTAWFSRVKPEAVQSVLDSVAKMEQGYFDENTYLWMHPSKGERYVRCGGTSQDIPGGYSLRGYHYDVDDVVREDQAKVVMLQETLNAKNEYYTTLETLGDVFYSMHVINLVDDTVVELTAKNAVKEIVNHKNGAGKMMHSVMDAVTTDEYKAMAFEFTDLSTLADRMKDKKILSRQIKGKNVGWILASFITMEKNEEGCPIRVIYTTRIIDEEKKQEEKLIHKSQTDELTGLLNRRAYEEDIYEHNDKPDEEHFIYVSLDVNGLKIVNDTMGHAAGDELIRGACQCMKTCLGSYGKLYRTGGDEFVAILFCDEIKVKSILDDFDENLANWSGLLVDQLSVSYGWISKEEEPEFSVRQLGVVADQRMYDAKTAHYKKIGVDRRGQQEAHKALCDLYTKILKINITDDTYLIVNMDTDEQTEEMGFSDKISEWLLSFGKKGNVHPEDLQEYLKLTDLQYMREYFLSDKTSLNIFYRRKYETGFKQVMMEIIPANDYSADNQSLYLYVKNIDR